MNHQTGEEFHSPSDKGEPVDYGYIGRLPRPDGRGTFLYLAGIHAMGTLGVTQYLEDAPGRAVPRGEEPAVLPAGAPARTTRASRAHDGVDALTPIYRSEGVA